MEGNMNLGESMKFVLKNKGQTIFTDFWKDDITSVLRNMKDEVVRTYQTGPGVIKGIKKKGFKRSMVELKDSAIDTIEVFKLVPKRVKDGFKFFREDLLKELEEQQDNKQKTIFCMKVIGALSSFTLVTVYGMKKNKTDIPFIGLRKKSAFTHFLVAELIFRLSQGFILRFLSEVEKGVSNPEDAKNLIYFKSILSDSSKADKSELLNDAVKEPGDRAFEIVDSLRDYILTGKRA